MTIVSTACVARQSTHGALGCVEVLVPAVEDLCTSVAPAMCAAAREHYVTSLESGGTCDAEDLGDFGEGSGLMWGLIASLVADVVKPRASMLARAPHLLQSAPHGGPLALEVERDLIGDSTAALEAALVGPHLQHARRPA